MVIYINHNGLDFFDEAAIWQLFLSFRLQKFFDVILYGCVSVFLLFYFEEVMGSLTGNMVYKRLRNVLAEALVLDEDEIFPSSSIVEDLFAESIDFLDIIFRLEKVFNIKISGEDIFPQDIIYDERLVRDGRLNKAGLKLWKERTPWLSMPEFQEDPVAVDLLSLITVEAIHKFLCLKLQVEFSQVI